jgi:hypothetical protein
MDVDDARSMEEECAYPWLRLDVYRIMCGFLLFSRKRGSGGEEDEVSDDDLEGVDGNLDEISIGYSLLRYECLIQGIKRTKIKRKKIQRRI